MRKTLIVLLVVLIVTLPAGHVLLNSPWLTERLVRRAFAKFPPGVTLREFKIGSQKFFWPRRFEFNDIRMVLALNGRDLSLACARIEIGDIRFRRGDREFDLWIDRVEASYDLLRVRNVRAELAFAFGAKGALLVEGPMAAEALSWDRAEARNVSAEFLADDKGVYFDLLKGEAFRGVFTGGADVFFTSPFAYSVRLLVKDMETDDLAALSPQVAEKMSGRVNGEVSVSGAGPRLTDFLADLSMPAGGRVNASFLATLTQYVPTLSNYLPSTREKARFDALIRSGGELAVETFRLRVQNDSLDHLAAALTIESREANVNWNLTYDVFVDGTWDDLLQSWQAIFK